MLIFTLSVILILVIASVCPILRWELHKRRTDNCEYVYEFSSDLIDNDFDNENDEDWFGENGVKSVRGSVRLFHGLVLTEEDVNRKRLEVYSCKLP